MDNKKEKQSFFTNSTPLIVGSSSSRIPRNKSSPNVAGSTPKAMSISKLSFTESIENLGRMKCMGSFTGLLEPKLPPPTSDTNGFHKDELVSLRQGALATTNHVHLQNQKSDPNGRPHKEDNLLTFEEALDRTTFGKFNYFLILICGTILTCVLLDTLGLSYVIPVSECDMKLTTRDKGILSAVGFAGIISSSHLWGFLADTKGRRFVIWPTLLIAFICNALSSITHIFWLFVVLRFLNGFFVSGSSATVYAYLGEFHTAKHRSRAIMWASVIFGITCVLLPLIAWACINQEWEFYIPVINTIYKPWRMYLVVCGLPSLCCSIAIFYLPESPKFVLAQGKQRETIQILQKVYRWNGNGKKSLNISSIIEEAEAIECRKQAEENKKSSFNVLKSMWSQTAPLFMQPHARKTLIACAVQFGTFVTSSGMYMWFPDILNRLVDFMHTNPDKYATLCEILDRSKLNISVVHAAAAAAVNQTNITDLPNCTTKLEIATFEHSIVLEILYAVGFAFIGIIINRAGKLPILLIVLVGSGICGIVTVYVNIPLLAIYMYLALLLCGLSVTVVNAATVDLVPTHLRAMAVCISLMMGRLGSTVGSNVVGLLLDNYCHLAFILSGSLLILCGVLVFFIPNIRDKYEEKEPSPQPAEPRLSVSISH